MIQDQGGSGRGIVRDLVDTTAARLLFRCYRFVQLTLLKRREQVRDKIRIQTYAHAAPTMLMVVCIRLSMTALACAEA